MKKKIQSGLYLIVDPAANRDKLLKTLSAIVREKIAAVQVWDNFCPGESPVELIKEILHYCHPQNIPVLVNNQWELLREIELDGVHFDNKQDCILYLKQALNREVITGITCGNDLSVVKWADENGMDYISFCSMFPSSTANSCELVTFDTIRKAKEMTRLPIFLAGGISPFNLHKLDELNYSGIAVVSGIMNAAEPLTELKEYQKRIKVIEK